MSTETSMTASKTLHRHEEHGLLFLTLTNSNGSALVVGEEVTIESNLSVDKRGGGTEYPFGIVTVGGADGELVTIATCLQRTSLATAKGGTLNAGTFVKPNGTTTNGIPEYVAAVDGDYISAIVLKGGNVDTEIVIGILRTPFRNTAPGA